MASNTENACSYREAWRLNWRIWRICMHGRPGYFVSAALSAAGQALAPYVTIWLSARVIAELAGGRDPQRLAFWAALTVGLTALMALANGLLKRWAQYEENALTVQKHKLLMDKMAALDYADCDRQEVQDLYSQIKQNDNWSGYGIHRAVQCYIEFCQAAVQVLAGVGFTLTLFFTNVPAHSPLAVLNSPLCMAGVLAAMVATVLASGAFSFFALLHPAGPVAVSSGGLLQPSDISGKLLVLRLLKGVLPAPVFPPGGEISLLNFDIRAVEGKHMVNAGIQKHSVMGYQDKSFLFPQVIRQQLSSLSVQMIGRLIYQKEGIFPQKHSCQQYPGLFSPGQAVINAVQYLPIHSHQLDFPKHLPVLGQRTDFLQYLQGHPVFFLHRKGEIFKFQRRLYRAPVLVFSHQKFQKRGFPFSISPGQSQPPAAVYLKADVLKHRFRTGLVGKG